MKGDYERYLADASIFMEFFSLIIMSWTWLDLGVHATKAAKSDGTYSKEFYESKIHTMKYFFTYELPKTTGLSTKDKEEGGKETASNTMRNNSILFSKPRKIYQLIYLQFFE